MNKNTVISLRSAITTAMAQVEKDFGVTVDLGNARFSDRSVKFQFNVIEDTIGANGDIVKNDTKVVDFQRSCYKWSLQPSDIGRSFISGTKTYTLAGAKPRNHKYPLIATDRNGKLYKFPASAVAGKLLL